MSIEKIKVNGRIYDIRDVEDVKKEETRAVAAENELLARIQGTSAKSDSRKDPFKFIGPISDEGYTYEALNGALDDLLYSNGVVGFNSGYFRARVQWREVEIKNIVLSTSSQNIVQVVSGAIIIDNGLIVADNAGGYTTLMRQHINGNWGEWKETYASGSGGEVSPELEAQVNENTANIAQNASDIKKLMDKEFPISVTLSVSNSVKNILEPDGNYTFSWSIKKGNDKVTPSSISLTVNGKAITGVTTNDTSYTYKYNSGGNVSPKLEANLVVTIEGNPHKASTSVTFVYPSYIGVVNNTFDINSADAVDRIKSLEQLIYSSKGCTYEVPVATAPQRVVYAYPKSFRALTSIKDANNLDMLNDFESSAQNVYVNTEYYVYILRDATMNKGTVTLKFS